MFVIVKLFRCVCVGKEGGGGGMEAEQRTFSFRQNGEVYVDLMNRKGGADLNSQKR